MNHQDSNEDLTNSKIRNSNILLRSNPMDKSSILNKSNSTRKPNLGNSSNFSFLHNTINNDNFYTSNFSPENQEYLKYKNLKISQNNLKYFNFGRSTNHSNMGFLTKTNFKNNKKNKQIYDKEKSSFIVNNTSLLDVNQTNIDQSINYNEHNILTQAGSSNTEMGTNVHFKKNNVMETAQNIIIAQDNNNNVVTKTNVNSNFNNDSTININMLNSPTKNTANNNNNYNINFQNNSNNLNNNINNMPTITRAKERKKTQFSNNGNKTIMNNIEKKDSNGVTKEEKELLNKFGAGIIYKDYNSEKNKFLETIYEKLNDKNTNNLKEQTTDYCQKFLNYSNKDVDDIVSK